MLVFDSRWVGKTGIGRFAYEISNRFEGFRNYTSQTSPVSPFDPFRLSIDKKIMEGDLFFSPGYNAPIFSKNIPYIFTIHDLNHIDRPENSSFLKKIYYNTVLRKLCKGALAIFTVSEFSKNRIVDYFNVSSSKVFVIGNGVSEVFCSNGNKSNVGYPYLFCVSNRKGHKNELALIKSFALSKASEHTKLLFSGELTDELNKLLLNMKIKNKVEFVGKISDVELAEYYRGALFSIFPSLYEGFGLPIVESFACDTPVITSNITSMPEISGDAALLVNPYDKEDLSKAIDLLYSDSNLRESLIKKGRERAKLYTWDSVHVNIENAFSALGYGDLLGKK
ncbi:MAG: glycosyltransferase family 1 protein [[Actinobacillus] rossii]|nr:glycosyltransferase family 1 protein [[Actinobacillus] rossii]